MSRTHRKHPPQLTRRLMSKRDLAHLLPRGLRPKMPEAQQNELEICHLVNLDALRNGDCTEQTLWDWAGSLLTYSFIAQELDQGIDALTDLLRLAERVIARYGRSGRIQLEEHEYHEARDGVIVMTELGALVDHRTAIAAAEWANGRLTTLSAGCRQAMREPA